MLIDSQPVKQRFASKLGKNFNYLNYDKGEIAEVNYLRDSKVFKNEYFHRTFKTCWNFRNLHSLIYFVTTSPL